MKTKLFILSVAFSVLCLFGCKTETIAVKEISLDKVTAEITKGETLQLTVKIDPENAQYKTLEWTSSDNNVATVDKNGLVTAIEKGEADITVDVDGITAVCKVTVVGIPVESVTLNQEQITLEKKQTAQLVATVLPEDADDKTVTWTSEDSNIATVDDKGLVTGVAAGETKIIAACGEVSAECVVTVEGIAVESIAIDKASLEMEVGETAQLTATVTPEDAENKEVIWTSSNEKVATVDETGLVTAIAVGEASIVAACGNIKTDCPVTVSGKKSESITLDKESITLFEGKTEQLTATVLPEDAEDKTVTWTSSDNSIATVDANGLVTAVAEGNATITATNTTLSATCAVTVKKEEGSDGPKVGDYYYSDGTYSSALDESKEVIAIVFYVGHHPADKSDYSATGIGNKECKAYAVALENSGKTHKWGVWMKLVGTAPVNDQGEYYYGDNSGDPNRPELKLTKDTDWNGYKSTQMIKTVADTDYSGLGPEGDREFPATYWAINYKEAPAASSGWFLPSTSQMMTAYEASKSSENFNIDAFKSFDKYDGLSFWTSSEDGWDDPSQYTFIAEIESGSLKIDGDFKDFANSYVRAIIAF